MENRLKPGCLAAQAPQRQCVSTHFSCQARVETLVYPAFREGRQRDNHAQIKNRTEFVDAALSRWKRDLRLGGDDVGPVCNRTGFVGELRHVGNVTYGWARSVARFRPLRPRLAASSVHLPFGSLNRRG
jgi:hypothetical protein